MKFSGIVHVILLCQLFSTEVLSQGSQRVNMQCEIENAEGNFPHVQGVQVKIGPKGEVGPQGLQGQVDYERINSTTDEKIKSGLTSLRSDIVKKLDVKEDKIQALQKQISSLASREGFTSLRSDMVKKLEEKEDKIQTLQKQISSLPSREVLENLFSQITDQLNEKEEKIQSLQEQLSALSSRRGVRNFEVNKTDETIETPQTKDQCDFVYKGTCYWVEIHHSVDTNYKRAESICNGRQSVLSYPVDETHYELMMKEIRLKMPSGKTAVYAWTGLGINPSTGDVTLATGGSAPYEKWFPGYPNAKSTSPKVGTQVNKEPGHSYQGFYNQSPSHKTYGAVCQYKLIEGN